MNIKHIITKTAYVVALVALFAPVSTFAATKTSTYYSSGGIGGGSSYYSYTPV